MGLYQNLFQAATKNFNKENYASVGSFRYKKDLEKNSQSHGRIAHERVEPLVFRNGKKRLDQSDSMDSNDSSELFMPVQMFQNHAVKLGIRNNS